MNGTRVLLSVGCSLFLGLTNLSRAHACRADVADFIPSATSVEAAFNDAIASLSSCSQGGIVYVPSGTYTFDSVTPVNVPSNITIEGDGPSSKLLAATGAAFFSTNGANGVTFRNLWFVLNSVNFSSGLALTGGDRVRVEGCTFSTSSLGGAFSTIHAVIADNVGGLVLTKNHLYATQFKLGNGLAAGPDTIVSNNRWSNTRNYAVSFVTRDASPGTEQRLIIEGNVVSQADDGSGGAFYVGTDSDTHSSAALEDIIIQGNIISSNSTNEGHNPIIVRAATSSKRIVIADNVISATSNPYVCILVKDYDSNTGAAMTSLSIRGNQVDGCQYGLWVPNVPLDAFNIADNTFRGSSGILLQPTRSPGLINGAVHDNIVSGGRISISANVAVSGVRISNNNVQCASTSNPGIVLSTSVAGTPINADLVTNTIRGCGVDYAEWGSGVFSGRRQ